jgi:hypothetical protein
MKVFRFFDNLWKNLRKDRPPSNIDPSNGGRLFYILPDRLDSEVCCCVPETSTNGHSERLLVTSHPKNPPSSTPMSTFPYATSCNSKSPFWGSLQSDRRATASLSPEQLLEEEGLTIAEIFLNVEEENVEELSPFNSKETASLSTTVDERPPLPELHLYFTALSDQERAALDALFGQIDTGESPCSTLSKQIAVVIGALCSRTVPIPWPVIGALFQVMKRALHNYYKRVIENRMTRIAGRPSILTEEERWVAVMIQELFANKMSITWNETLNEIELHFGKCILQNVLAYHGTRVFRTYQ